MSGRRRRDDVAPSLFPFLAVLVCTMGALVLILMLVVSNAQATAKEVAKAVEVEQMSEEMVALSEEMQKVRAKQQAEIDRQQGELAHLEDHINRLNEQLEELAKKHEAIDKDTEGNFDADGLAKEKEKLLEEIAKTEEKLKEEAEKEKHKKPAYSIIPYQGPNGTSRRPIYLECVADGVIIQPEGFKLSLNDLRPPHGPGNPLDAVLRAVRSHLEKLEATGGVAPYPLLIVRPDGIRTYAMARSAMASWDDQFGYELVGADMDLKFPPFEKPIGSELEQVVSLARERQVALIAAMPGRMRGMLADDFGDGDTFGPIGQGGDAAGDEAGDEALAGEFVEDAELVQEIPGVGGNGVGGNGTDPPSLAKSGSAGGNSSEVALRNSQMPADANMLPNGIGPIGQPGGSFGATGSALGAPGSSFTANGGTTGSNPGATVQPFAPLANNGTGYVAQGLRAGQRSTGSLGANAAASGQGLALNDAGGSLTENSSQGMNPAEGTAVGQNGNTINNSTMSEGTLAGANNSRQADSGGTDSSGTGQATGQRAQAGKVSGTPPPEGTVWRDMQGSGDATSGAPGSEGGAGLTVSSSKAASSSKNKKQDSSSANAKPSSSADESTAGSIVISRGSDWTRQNIRGTAVERTIRIRCQEDRWVIQPEPGQQGTKTIFLRRGMVQARNDLAKALQGRVDSWGMALAGGYWKPKVIVEVDPKAQARYEQLVRVLEGSGIEVSLAKESKDGQKP